MAYSGYGIWALVVQQLFNATVDTIILWLTVKWRPKKMFSVERIRTLFAFGWKLLVSSLLDTVYNNIRQLIIGKMYSSSDLAYYNRGKQFPDLIVNNINTSIDSVLLPTMSSKQDDRMIVKKMTRRAIKTSTYIIAPLMICFLLGYSYQKFPSLRRPMKWQGLCLRSMIRGTMEICMGCLSFRMAEFMKKISFNNVAKTLLFFVSWMGYGGVIWYSYSHTGSKADWILLMILWLSVTITCSEQSIVMPLFSNKLFSWFGSFSFSLYLGHGFWAKEMRNLFPQMGEGRMLILYVILAVVTGLFIQYTSLGLRKFWKVKGEAVKRIFIE